MTKPMSVEQRWGKYRRLRAELDVAYAEPHWNRARIDRLADEITALEIELSRETSVEQALTSTVVPSADAARSTA